MEGRLRNPVLRGVPTHWPTTRDRGPLWMTTHPEWQFVGSVPENYERYLVPSIFGARAVDLVDAAGVRLGEQIRPAMSAGAFGE
jgi:hypothetical protein